VFGHDNYRNEISWKRSQPKSHTTINFSNCRDIILRYSKTQDAVFNKVFGKHDPDYIEKFYRFTDLDGRRYRLGDITNPNKNRPNLTYEFLGVKRVWRWTKDRMQKAYEQGLIYQSKPGAVPQEKRYLDEMEGQPVSDDWSDIEHLHGANAEALGYPTQKPVALLERIILASSNPGGLVLDPFCGCGTTIDAAEKNGRDWIGIDITQLAITLIKKRLFDTYGYNLQFVSASTPEQMVSGVAEGGATVVRVIGEPVSPEDAAKLAEDDKYQFQWWALGLVGARPEEQKKGADHGIDGKILFRDDSKSTKPEQIIIQVKGGKTSVKDVRDLRGVLDREKAAIGILISLQPPTSPMETEAASVGFYEHKTNKQKFPRLQLRTVKELMEGKGIERPTSAASLDDTFKKAPESKKKHGHQAELKM
jgi:site-specific DNA-methyltransferase (adenine-specific)